MTEKLLVVTYNDDLPQFEVMAHCLNRNWQGNPKITVVFGKPNPGSAHLPGDIETAKNIVAQEFDSRWSVEVIDGSINNIIGYQEQQINKIRFSLDTDDTIVFDSKDFLLKPADLRYFKIDNQYRIGYINNNQTFDDMYPSIKDIVTVSKDTPTTFITTPWIWPKQQLQKYWDFLQNKFGPYTQWQSIPGGSEWAGFFAYTWNDVKSTMPMTSDEYEFVNFGGVWQSADLAAIQDQITEFGRWPERRIWKHNRKVRSIDTVPYTAQVLSMYGIDQKVIDRWTQQHIDRMSLIDLRH